MKNLLIRLFHYIYKYADRSYWSYIYRTYKKVYEVHDFFLFNGRNIKLMGEGKIILGPHSYIGDNSTFSVNKDCSIKVGKYCSMSHNIKMYANTYIVDQDFSVLPLKERSADIVIGDYVWIGANVFINPGVTIGDNSIIGANSVINKDVEAFSIVGGVPARLIRYKNGFEKNT